MDAEGKKKLIYKVVLSGGPCAGKTTTVARLRIFFENIGWKVYTVPESATILLSGVKFAEFSPVQAEKFQRNILKTIIQLESTFFELAEEDTKNVLVVCDRGTMDPSAFCSDEEWSRILAEIGYDSISIRDARYNQVVHMMTAANGAESFYQLENNPSRSEGLELAREMDTKAALAWVGHPYYDVVDNSTDFESKIRRVIELIYKRIAKQLGIDVTDDRLQSQSKKRKFLIRSLPDLKNFPKVEDFDVQHDYLLSSNPLAQIRIRRRGQKGNYTYTHTERTKVNGERVERIMQLSFREYQTLYKQRDFGHYPVVKTRRCFLYNRQYYQLDIFKGLSNKRCHELLLLETYTTKKGDGLELPKFLDIVREVTDDPHYSMYFLSSVQEK